MFHDAVHPTVLAFAPLVGAVLGVALVAILLLAPTMRKKNPALAQEVWKRYLVWVAIAALVVGALAIGRTAWIVGVALLALATFREYARGVGLWMDVSFQGVVYLFILLLHVAAWWPYATASGEPADPGWYGLFMVLPVFGTLFVFAVPILRGVYEHMLQKLALAIVALVYFAWFLAHYAFLINLSPAGVGDGVGSILFLTTLVAVNDVAAFVVGKLIGRHKLAPRLSPGKTWEGAAGALAIVVGLAFAMRWLVPFMPTPHLVVAAVLVAVGGVFGDLALSTIKRDIGIKDWGTTLPGHGGLLDRANSLIFTTPILFHFLRYFFTVG